jgi:hypothetical protein
MAEEGGDMENFKSSKLWALKINDTNKDYVNKKKVIYEY